MIKWRWVAAGFVVVVGWILVALGSIDQPPYSFIEKLHGVRIPNPYGENSGLPESLMFYGFRGSPKTVAEAAGKDFMTLGPIKIKKTTRTPYERDSGTAFNLVEGEDVPKGYTCFVMVKSKSNWLAEKWQVVRSWFHRDQAASRAQEP